MGSTGLHESYWMGPDKPTPRWRLWVLRWVPHRVLMWWLMRQWQRRMPKGPAGDAGQVGWMGGDPFP